ncbi:hypothetical protein HBA55_29590 [Pseudomaricurvus alkylphenolicus]|uniref:hypothetical protein n=1 Tax=Pseudomaricurvus alkylphenolicus TaxID=1306991 RepID=UPI001422A3EA|nr:hypothetical protein [Pseudomaricurvus alkylphenolicus]NIB43792.1 hypothetical protein [Pseudomaricurvus alkylphenolicus]
MAEDRNWRDDTVNLLDQWSRWLGGRLDTEFNSGDALQRLRGSAVPCPIITDHDALIVDGVLAQLKFQDREMYDIVTTYHRECSNITKLARRLGQPRQRVNVLYESGIAWVGAKIDFSSLESLELLTLLTA